MKNLKTIYRKNRKALGALIILLGAIAGATATIVDDKAITAIEKGVEFADKLLLEELPAVETPVAKAVSVTG